VDSASVSFFITKAVNRHLPFAFLIAANGVTGKSDQLASARAHLHNALVKHDCKVIVLDRAADHVSLEGPYLNAKKIELRNFVDDHRAACRLLGRATKNRMVRAKLSALGLAPV
jgi:hypothetical protein